MLGAFLAAVVVGASVTAGPIKVWSVGEYLTSTDLNANFQHIHTTMVGGHGPRLMNSDVNSNARIAHSKLANPGVLPKLWAIVANCTSSPCTMQETSGITSVTRSGTGRYDVQYPARLDDNIAPLVTSTGADAFKHCAVVNYDKDSCGVECIAISSDAGVNAYADDGFSIVIFDEGN